VKGLLDKRVAPEGAWNAPKVCNVRTLPGEAGAGVR
jgi:hypothetical protein